MSGKQEESGAPAKWVPKVGEVVLLRTVVRHTVSMERTVVGVSLGLASRGPGPELTEVTLGQVRPDPVPLLRELAQELHDWVHGERGFTQASQESVHRMLDRVGAAYPETFRGEKK